MSLLVRNGTVVSPEGRFHRDIRCDDGMISWIGNPGAAPGEADHVVDASGMLVFPGIIDPHVHSRDPGLTDKEEFEHLTRGAITGGVTTILEMPNAVPPIVNPDIVADRIDLYNGRSFCDFGLWGMVTGSETVADLRALKGAGVVGAKLFWGYSLDRATGALIYGATSEGRDVIPPASNGDVWRLLRNAAEVGLLIGVHCEDLSVAQAAERCHGAGGSTVADLQAVRPPVSEAVAVATLIELARDTGARAHVLHVSTAWSMMLISAARASGVAITAETCPHYLSAGAESKVSIGLDNKVFPPLRGGSDLAALWEAVADGNIASIGSDHAPHTAEDYDRSFDVRPAGVPGTQTLLAVTLTHALEGRISLERLVEVLCEGTARLYGLYPRKGTIRPGADADLAVIDPDKETIITAEGLHTKSRHSPWIGRTARGRVAMTILRGQVVAENGEIRRSPEGEFISPKLS